MSILQRLKALLLKYGKYLFLAFGALTLLLGIWGKLLDVRYIWAYRRPAGMEEQSADSLIYLGIFFTFFGALFLHTKKY